MSLDDVTNPHHAAALERGENPQKPPTAQFRLATLLAEHDNVHTIHHQMLVAGRVLAFLPRIQSWADAESTRPERKKLRGQQVAALSDEDEAIERAHYHREGLREAMASLAAMRSPHADEFDADLAGVRDDDRRAKQDAQSEAAIAEAPSVRSA